VAYAADEPPGTSEPDDRRTEFGGLPSFSVSPESGFALGLVWTVARFTPTHDPFRWRLYGLQRGNVTWETGEATLASYRSLLEVDLPGLAGGKLRVRPRLDLQRVLNTQYFGLGNSSVVETAPDGTPEEIADRFGHYRWLFVDAELYGRYKLRDVPRATGRDWVEVTGGLDIRFSQVGLYDDSRLARDAAFATGDEVDPRVSAALVDGLEDHVLVQLVGGIAWDTRDDEFVPIAGGTLSAGATAAASTNFRLRYGQLKLDGRVYRGIVGSYLSYAGRAQVDLISGRAPLYVLDGSNDGFSIRGILNRQYVGWSKVIHNSELRSQWFGFRLLKQDFTLGGAALLDAGRVWVPVEAAGAVTENGAWHNVHAGAGGGLRLQWGGTFIVRFDVAKALTVDEGPRYYLAIGQHF
jgi:hypothetical protein